MSDPFKVVVVGPLAPFTADFQAFLARLGYAPDSASHQLQLLAHLSRWMTECGLDVHGLSPVVVGEFFRDRCRTYRNFRTPRSLATFITFLDSASIERVTGPPPVVSAQDQVLGIFEQYLLRERSLEPTTVLNYLNQLRPFVRWRMEHTGSGWTSLAAVEVTDFLLWRGTNESIGSIQVAATALRAFLRWLFLVRLIPASLAESVPSVAYSPHAGLPKFLTQDQVQAIVKNPPEQNLAPLRNQALVLVLSRTGLRSREVQNLSLDDVDWRAGTLRITGKGGRIEHLPLPVDAGGAIVEYLQKERPASTDRHLFLQAAAPHHPLSRTGVSIVVTARAARAGLDFRVGAHRLRHSLATSVLDHGGSLEEAAQLLRHSSTTSTMIYAKVNQNALRLMVMSWPFTPGIPTLERPAS